MNPSWVTWRAAVAEVVEAALASQDPAGWLTRHLAARIAEIRRAAPAPELLAWMRADDAVNFVVYDAPRGVCSKPPELVHALLETLVRELVAEAR